MTSGRSGEQMDRRLGKEGRAACSEDGTSVRYFPKEMRAVFAVAARVFLACLVVAVVTGCGRYKEELQEAKQRIETLTSENKKLAENVAASQKDKTRLQEEVKLLSDKNDGLQSSVQALRKAKAALEEENSGLKKRTGTLQTELTSLKRDKEKLEREVGELKKRVAEPMRSVPPLEAEPERPGRVPTAVDMASKLGKGTSPCDAIIEFMRSCEQIVRMNRGEQRKRLLEQAKREFDPRMQGAPRKALEKAEAWVKELSKSWDKPGDDTVFNLISKRNAVLEACKKKPEEAGF